LRKFSNLLICSLLLFSMAIAMDFDQEGILRSSLNGEVSILNPVLSTDNISSAVEGAIFNGLITFNEKLEVIPELAASWQASKDGKTWTFNLRRDVFWHDGRPFTSATFHVRGRGLYL